MDKELIIKSVDSYDIDLEDVMERWKNNLYEVSTRRCTQITTLADKDEFGPYRFD
jgi:hypothetical protein